MFIDRALASLRRRWESAAAALLVVGAMLVHVELALYIDRPIVDDAAISIAFGRTLVGGYGGRVTPYSQIVEGFSNPTWTVLLGVIERLGINSMAPAKYAGLVFTTLALPLVSLWGPVSQRRRIRLEDAAAPLVASTNGSLAYWALGGLESGFLVFLLSLLGLLLFAPRSRRIAIALGLTAAAVTLTRPEGALYAGALALPAVIETLVASRLRPRREDGIAFGTFLGPVLLYVLFRRWYFGAWLPNTYYAKHSWVIGLDLEAVVKSHIEAFVDATKLLFIVSGISVVLSFAGKLKTAKTAVGATLLVGSMFFFTWYANADWMKEWRFLAPTVPFVCHPIGAACAAIRQRFGASWLQRRRWLSHGLHAVLAGAVVTVILLTSKDHRTRWTSVKDQGSDVPLFADRRAKYAGDLREMIAPFHMTHPLVAGPDMGWLAIGMQDAEIIDVAGLADVAIARHYGNPKALGDYLVNEGLPSILLVWGPSHYLRGISDVIRNYRPGPHSTYLLYSKMSPTEDERCPGGKASAMSDTAEQMTAKVIADLESEQAVRALALWRCYLSYRPDAELPALERRLEIARKAEALAQKSVKDGRLELALRDYSLCAVIGAASHTPSVSCRFRAERIRSKLFPRPATKKSK